MGGEGEDLRLFPEREKSTELKRCHTDVVSNNVTLNIVESLC